MRTALLVLMACDGSTPTTSETDPPASATPSTATACTDALPISNPSPLGRRIETDRVVLDTALSEADGIDAALQLDAAVAEWEAFFDRSWEGRIDLTYTLDEASFRMAVVDAGDTPPDGIGGYYSGSADRAFLYRQPSVFGSDVLMLHEASHLVHRRIRDPAAEPPFWYLEGLAETLGRRHWDGRCISLGVTPLASQADRLALALDESATVDVQAVLDGTLVPSRSTAIALFRYLETSDATSVDFQRWRREADAAEHDYTGFQVDRDAYQSWLTANQAPYDIVYGSWLHVDATTIRGGGEFTTLLRRKDIPATFTVEHPLPTGDTLAGILTGYDDGTHFDALYIDADGTLLSLVDTGSGPVFETLGNVTPTDPVVWTWDPATGALGVGDGTFQVATQATGTAGLAVYAGSIQFEQVR